MITNPQSTQSQFSRDEISYSPSRTNNYKTIRSFVGFYQAAAVLSILGGVIIAGVFFVFGLIVIVAAQPSAYSYNSTNYGFFIALPIWFLGGMQFVVSLVVAFVFAFIAECINVLVDIEANGRQAAQLLERILIIKGI